MRILFLSEHHPGSQGGIQTFGRVLKQFFKEELFFLIFNSKENKDFKEIFFVENVYKMAKENVFFKILNKLLKNELRENLYNRKINKFLPDIVILGFPNEINYIKNEKIKTILVQHTNYETFISVFCNNNLDLIKKLKEKLDMFVFLSEYDRKKFVKNLNFPLEKTIVIRHSCQVELLTENKEKNKNLIMICRLENKSKRIDLAIRAMKKLKNFTLNIYGDGPDKEFLGKLIKEEKLENVILHGGTNQVKEKLDENSIFIMTSDFEGYPISTIEAMRRGLPIILRNTFEAAEDIVIDNGELLEKEWNEDKFIEAIYKIYENYEYYSKNAIEKGRRHNFEIIKSQWEELFKKLLQKEDKI